MTDERIEDRIASDVTSGSILEALLKGHLWIEHFLNEGLNAQLPHPEHVDIERMSFARKIELCAALGLLNAEDLPAYRRLNTMRNHAAHYLDRAPSKQAVDELQEAMGPNLLELFHQGSRSVVRRGTEEWRFRLQLILIVLAVNSSHSRKS